MTTDTYPRGCVRLKYNKDGTVKGRKNAAGGLACKYTHAPGYNPWPRWPTSVGDYNKPLYWHEHKHANKLASGIFSVAMSWGETPPAHSHETGGIHPWDSSMAVPFVPLKWPFISVMRKRD